MYVIKYDIYKYAIHQHTKNHYRVQFTWSRVNFICSLQISTRMSETWGNQIVTIKVHNKAVKIGQLVSGSIIHLNCPV